MNTVRHGIGASRARTAWRVLGLLVALSGLACFALEGPLFVHTLGFAKQFMSPDHHITVEGIAFIHRQLTVAGALLLAAGISVVICAAPFSEMFSRLVGLPINLTDRRFSLVLLWSSSITGLILVVCWLLRGIPGMSLLYGEDAPLETLTAILFIGSSFLLLGAAMFHRQRLADHRKVVAVLLVGIAIAYLFFGLEEISWGQRLFGWTTPRILQRSNYQGELNVHNLVNPILGRLYRWGMAAFALLTAAGWLRLSRFTETMLRFLIPHGAMAGLLLLMLLFGTIIPQQELLEQLGASFALFYALTAFRTSRQLHKIG